MSDTTTIRIALLIMFPEFKQSPQTSDDDTRIEIFVNKAKEGVNEKLTGSGYDYRVMELACHFMAESPFFKSNINFGTIVREKYGRDEIEYQKNIPTMYKRYGSTVYGRMFEDNMKKYFAGRGLV